MKPDFNTMSKPELRAYVMAHRNDNEAFYTLVDRFRADSKNNVQYPCPKTPEDLAQMEKAIQAKIEELEKS